MTYKQIFNALNSVNQKQLAKYVSEKVKCDKLLIERSSCELKVKQ